METILNLIARAIRWFVENKGCIHFEFIGSTEFRDLGPFRLYHHRDEYADMVNVYWNDVHLFAHLVEWRNPPNYWYVITGHQGVITTLLAEGLWHCRFKQILAGPFSCQEIAEDAARLLALDFMLGDPGENDLPRPWNEVDFAILSAGEVVEETGYTCDYCDQPAVVLDDDVLLCQAHTSTQVHPVDASSQRLPG